MPFQFFLWCCFVVLQSLIGFRLVHRRVRQGVVWLFPLLSVLVTHLIFLEAHPAIRMLVLIIPLLHAMKIVVANIHPDGTMSGTNWVIYYFGTVNMNPSIFKVRKSIAFDLRMFIAAVVHMAVGLAIVWWLRYTVVFSTIQEDLFSYWGHSLLALVALSLVLHFGLLPFNTLWLQKMGIPASPAFRQPFKSKSLSEFWGRRWNIPFTEMTATAVFKPLAKKMGVKQAGFVSFMVSGMLHEVAISLSVMQYFGWPMLYFVIHGVLMAVEKKWFGNRPPGTWWVLCGLVLPLPVLFHPAFLDEVVWAVIFSV